MAPTNHTTSVSNLNNIYDYANDILNYLKANYVKINDIGSYQFYQYKI